jgi:hypothetical protein
MGKQAHAEGVYVRERETQERLTHLQQPTLKVANSIPQDLTHYIEIQCHLKRINPVSSRRY